LAEEKGNGKCDGERKDVEGEKDEFRDFYVHKCLHKYTIQQR
jgi:hypothetical protein